VIAPEDLKRTLMDVVAVLATRRIGFHITGGLASSFYGEPRFTQDIDIVIVISQGPALAELMIELEQKFLLDRIAVEDAVRRQGLFQALHEETMIKVDFHVGEAVPGELGRSRHEEILLGVVVPLVSKEDSILSKLVWMSKGSHKSRQDVKMMLIRPAEVDLDYLRSQAVQLGVVQLLNEVTTEIEKDKRTDA
jgi:hypothetical protein